MKIVNIITGLNCGGAENLLLSICKNNKKTKKEQLVIYLTKKEYLLDEFKKEDIKTIFVDVHKLGILRAIIKINKLVRKFNPDIVNTHLVMADTLGRFACLFIKHVKVFSTIHSLDHWITEKKVKYKILRWYNRFTLNYFRKNSLIAVSESSRLHCINYERINPDKIYTLCNYVVEEKRGAIVHRDSFNIKEDDFLFINVGRLTHEKSQMDILKSAKKLKEEGIAHVKFIILGDGELKEKLKSYISDNDLSDMVILVGKFVNNVHNYFDISNALLVSSTIEGFGLVILEAFQAKLPVLSTYLPATKELITQNETGLFYEAGNIMSLTENIKAILNGKYVFDNIVNKAYAYYKELTNENYYEKLYQIYNNTF